MRPELFFEKEQTLIDLYPDAGFEHFDLPHLIWLGVILLSTVLIGRYYKRQPQARKDSVKRFFAVAVMIAEILKDTILVITGETLYDRLPLHLCSLAMFAMVADAFGKRKGQAPEGFLKQSFAYAFMPGTVSALLFCDWTAYPMFHYMTIFSFVFHGTILLYFYMQYISGEIRVTYGGLWKVLGGMVAAAIPVYFVNEALSCNYMFLNAAPADSPLVFLWDVFGTRFGEAGYLLAYFGLAVAVLHVLFIIYRGIGYISKLKNNDRKIYG